MRAENDVLEKQYGHSLPLGKAGSSSTGTKVARAPEGEEVFLSYVFIFRKFYLFPIVNLFELERTEMTYAHFSLGRYLLVRAQNCIFLVGDYSTTRFLIELVFSNDPWCMQKK